MNEENKGFTLVNDAEAVRQLPTAGRNKSKKLKEEFTVKGSELVDKIKEIIQLGNATRIKVKKGEKYLLDIPVTVGAVGVVLAPFVSALGVIAALVGHCSLEIDRRED